MNNLIDAFKIALGIFKSKTETFDSKEEEVYKLWSKDPANKRFIDEITSNHRIKEKIGLYDSADKEAVWAKTLDRISIDKKSNYHIDFWNRGRRIAAILVIGLLISMGVSTLMLLNQNEQTEFAHFLPGSSKAILIMEDGKQINLNSNDQEVSSSNGFLLRSKQSILDYMSQSKLHTVIEEEIKMHTLIVPLGGEYRVSLSDGTKVWMNSASTLKYPVLFTGETREVELVGEAYFEVSKGDKEFRIKSGEAQIIVLGTSFNLRSYPDDDNITTTLVTGKVKMNVGEKELDLTPGLQGRYHKVDKSFTAKPVNVKESIAWKDGVFYFEEETLEEILKQYGRWYDMKVKFENSALKSKTYTGVFKKDDAIEVFFDMVSETSDISFEAKGDTIIIKNQK
ncbi:FecR family protein [Belliella kenyensis]|uniref:FecR family protein n=1 Tax=Belliella kenyensis TaxID=1472724 RepID=A0ABV8EH84_9BACT|nr:FecR domain-containing protein [Belliella kenyensis]MCH7401045.1 DUF4974 domain-containing protein [Belliella kenyensis]MDN3604043.1 DUF4974 domain-containing protein [Belliella kenyensis]